MPLLLPILLGLMIFLIIKYVTVITTITAIVISGVAVIVFVGIWQGTLYFLKKLGYYIPNKRQTYRQVDSDLKQMCVDLQEIHSQLEGIEPHLRDMEFLKYVPQNTEVKKGKT